MKGEGFAFFHWRHTAGPRVYGGIHDRVALSLWGDMQRRAFFRRMQAARGKAK